MHGRKFCMWWIVCGWPGSAVGPEHSQAIHGSAVGSEQIGANSAGIQVKRIRMLVHSGSYWHSPQILWWGGKPTPAFLTPTVKTQYSDTKDTTPRHQKTKSPHRHSSKLISNRQK